MGGREERGGGGEGWEGGGIGGEEGINKEEGGSIDLIISAGSFTLICTVRTCTCTYLAVLRCCPAVFD